MTDFILEDGTVIRIGQKWILMYNRPFMVTICQLLPRESIVRTQTNKQRGTDNYTDIDFITIEELYDSGMAFIKSPEIIPEKVIPRFKFIS